MKDNLKMVRLHFWSFNVVTQVYNLHSKNLIYVGFARKKSKPISYLNNKKREGENNEIL